MLTSVEKEKENGNGIRGGVTIATCHYVEANNKYMHNYDKSKAHSF